MSEVAQVRLRHSKDPPCPRHSTVEAIFVCLENGCQESIACPECIIAGGAHIKHEMTLLTKHLDIFQKKINDFNLNTRENVLVPMKEKVGKVTDDLLAFDPSTTTLLKEIETKGEEIKNHTDTLIAEFKTKCSRIRASNRQMLEQYKSALLAKISEIEADISALDNCLTGECKEDIVDAANTGILKTYPCLEYPNGIQDVSFNGSETPVKNVVKLIGKVQIGNEYTREEPDDEKIKRLEAQVTDLTQEIKRDQTLIQKLQEEMRGFADKEQTYQTRILALERETRDSAKQMETDKARIKTLQANNDGLAGELRDQKRVSGVKTEELEQKIQNLEKRFLCSVSIYAIHLNCTLSIMDTPVCRTDVRLGTISQCNEEHLQSIGCDKPKELCRCTTCPSCYYKGTDFKALQCLECDHVFIKVY